MTMTDEELDRDWEPNGRRPQSTIAQMFSQELMDIFRIENSIADLDEQVDRRKQHINSQTSELEALEARIREMERRLKMQTSLDNPGSAAQHSSTAAETDAPPPPPEKDQPDDQKRAREQQQLQQQQQQKYAGSRPSTAHKTQPAVPGALPPTPAGSEDGDRERDA
ncbi:f57fe666-b182-4e6f-bf43-98d15a6fed21 [Thermothielavioides terrestris]|uniref:F57fe666-b182-4e6f-bf43-98d15a6fed21 n=1 Tax=Thermothielavioides terrestris TaxID=2587410 RepID=A0A446BXE6_9PEZI|nr:f57fe666-b182-4e6f-bf43-98d15a6fed21 [Thermothielavioides terrestris]